jgi:hypothetical protein
MSFPVVSESALFDVDETALLLPQSERIKEGQHRTTLRIINEIAKGLSEKGYRIGSLKRNNISDASLDCSKSDFSADITIFADKQEGGKIHCELNIWRFYSTLQRNPSRKEKILRDTGICEELRVIIDDQLRRVPGIDALRWQPRAERS